MGNFGAHCTPQIPANHQPNTPAGAEGEGQGNQVEFIAGICQLKTAMGCDGAGAPSMNYTAGGIGHEPA
jgi:hypothetical protein